MQFVTTDPDAARYLADVPGVRVTDKSNPQALVTATRTRFELRFGLNAAPVVRVALRYGHEQSALDMLCSTSSCTLYQGNLVRDHDEPLFKSRWANAEGALRVAPEVDNWKTYQWPGVEKLVTNGCGLLRWPPGSGKSKSGISIALAFPGPRIIVTRASNRAGYIYELAKWTKSARAFVVTGIGHDNEDLPEGYDFYVTGVETLQFNIARLLRLIPKTIVWDESDLDTPAQRWQSVPKIEGSGVDFIRRRNRAASAQDLALAASHNFATTATLFPNRPRDGYAQGDLIEPGGWGSWGAYARRYCLDGSTPILLSSGVYKPIAEINKGDEVIGWGKGNTIHNKLRRVMRQAKVLDTTQLHGPRFKVELASGRSVTCTPDHRWLVRTGAKEKNGGRNYQKLFREERQRKTSWRRPISHIISVAAPPSSTGAEITDAYRLGYVRGLLDGDGHATETEDGQRAVIASKEKEHMEVAFNYATHLGLCPASLLHCKDGMWKIGFHRAEPFAALTAPWPKDTEFRRGWLAGMYDAEATGNRIAQYWDANPEKHAFLRECLQDFNFDVSGGPESVTILGGRRELQRFVDLVRPKLSRKLVEPWKKGGYKFKGVRDEIISITRIEDGPVYTLTTETGNYIANGLGSKNCARVPNAFGGFDDNGSAFADELRMRWAAITHEVPQSAVNAEMPPIRIVPAFIPKEGQPDAEELREALAEGTSQEQSGLMQAALRARPYVLDRMEETVRAGGKVAIFTGWRADAERMAKAVSKCLGVGVRRGRARKGVEGEDAGASATPVVLIHGGTGTSSGRIAEMEPFILAPGGAVLIGTIGALGRSLDGLQCVNLALFQMLPYTPGEFEQAIGRFPRLGRIVPCLIELCVPLGSYAEKVVTILLEKGQQVCAIASTEVLSALPGVLLNGAGVERAFANILAGPASDEPSDFARDEHARADSPNDSSNALDAIHATALDEEL